MTAEMIGSLILAIPAIGIAWVAFYRRAKAIFWFVVVLTALATAYLNLTGATRDIGERFAPAGLATSAPSR